MDWGLVAVGALGVGVPVGFIGAVMTLVRRYIYPGIWCWPWQDAERIQREQEQEKAMARITMQDRYEAEMRRVQEGFMAGLLGFEGRTAESLACTGEDTCACGPCKQDRTRRQKAKAEFRAHDLLLEKLAPEQQAEWKKDRSFTVTTAGKRRYRIWGTRGRSFNVFLLDDAGKQVKSFCATKYGDLPLHDLLLTQKLALETDEAGFLLTANARNEVNPYEMDGFGIQPGVMPGAYGPIQDVRIR